MSSIGGIGSNHSMMMQGMGGMKRPDPAQLAKDLFAKLDTSGQGYIQKADLQAAFDKVTSSSSSSGTTTNVDDLFSQLDADSDGKVTQQEFSDTLKQVAEQLDNQFMNSRMSGAMPGGGMGGMPGGGMGAMPPPPPPSGKGDSGVAKDGSSSQLSGIGSSDSQRSSLVSNTAGNFDEADSNGDGTVSFKEAMAYNQSTASSSTATAATDTATSASDADVGARVMLQIMRLMQAYSVGNDPASTLSVTA